jgi:hypothetical protein
MGHSVTGVQVEIEEHLLGGHRKDRLYLGLLASECTDRVCLGILSDH